MGGGDQIDIMGSLTLQFQKNFTESLCGNIFAIVFVAQFVVLAENAFESAAGKEYGSAAVGSTDARFFPEM